ncbi:hypothetical protein [Pseudomonas sp. RIT-PI-AD]|uniref:hypothetical protein n=1 Tax=Pseudomonas sp. RIT-PI-AD TaxID=3035294 RepID=UPI0021D80E35|nr:hypothetical protein [Pseudomonas sp. RIT-PI-AD]
MRKGLTRQLAAALALAVTLGAGAAPAEQGDKGLSGAEQQRYIAELKRLYLTDNERKALLAHCNDLLKTYALRAGYQVGQGERDDLFYQLSVGAQGELLAREERRAEHGNDVAVHNARLSVFGVDPFIRYECPQSGISCVFYNPADGSPWLRTVRDFKGAGELAKALSFLVRNVQKG